MIGKMGGALLSGLLFSTVAYADFKRLVCEQPITVGLPLMVSNRDWHQNRCDKGSANDCATSQRLTKQMEDCKASGGGDRMVFSFETSSLEGKSSMYAEKEYIACDAQTAKSVSKVGIESTPSFIVMKLPNDAELPHDTFVNAGLDKFVIDRQTLVGTYAKKSDWNCKVEDIPNRRNKI